MTDIKDELAAHRETVRELMSPGRALAIDSPHRTNVQPQWFGESGRPTLERELLHKRLLERFRAGKPDVAAERRASMLAERCPAATRYELHRVDAPAGKPQLETVLERSRRDAALGAGHVAEGASLSTHASSTRPARDRETGR